VLIIRKAMMNTNLPSMRFLNSTIRIAAKGEFLVVWLIIELRKNKPYKGLSGCSAH